MTKPFRTAPLDMLAGWIFRELDGRDTVMGIPRQNFQLPSARMGVAMFGHHVAAPLGVAAGPPRTSSPAGCAAPGSSS